jgi:16S rRNA (guanine527-N7)-methyltransferase
LGHFADSLSALSVEQVFKARAIRAVDIGTGAGFPGLPIKIMNHSWQMTLLESTGKKCDFLKAVVGAMELSHVEIIYKRAEELGHDPEHRECYDLAFARALSSLATLLEYALPLLKVGGYLVTHRGRTAAEEVTRVDNALHELGGNVAGVHHYEIPGLGGSRALVVIRKDRANSKHYPRRTGVAAKRPL